MKIKITGNTEPYSWYRNKIGETFDVLEVDEKDRRYITHRGYLCDAYVCFDDAGGEMKP